MQLKVAKFEKHWSMGKEEEEKSPKYLCKISQLIMPTEIDSVVGNECIN